ncbi:MAG: hypothetical protein AAF790_12490, partial [Planctomycetota bacterium]
PAADQPAGRIAGNPASPLPGGAEDQQENQAAAGDPAAEDPKADQPSMSDRLRGYLPGFLRL